MQKLLSTQESLYNDYVKDWKERGGKVLGYACVALPLELIEAAGILPYRIKALGRLETDLADAHMSLFNCSFCRACLQKGLDGSYDFLDGLVETNGCDHLRNMFEHWQREKEPDFFHYVRVPHFLSEESISWFEEELALFRDALCDHFPVEITDKSLIRAIQKRDSVCEKLKRLYEMRERSKPAVTGTEVFEAVTAWSSMPSGDFDDYLSRVIEEKSGAQIPEVRARLMICGAISDEIDLIREIEGLGGLVVADTACFGSRIFWNLDEGGGREDPIRMLAVRYLSNLLCPRMYLDYEKRRDFTVEIQQRAKADGVIIFYNKFCDLHGVDAVLLRRDLEEKEVPVLILEKEYGSIADFGRLKTRVQAFLERIGR